MDEQVILVVDDEDAQRKVLAGFLRKRGYEILTAASVDEALGLHRSAGKLVSRQVVEERAHTLQRSLECGTSCRGLQPDRQDCRRIRLS